MPSTLGGAGTLVACNATNLTTELYNSAKAMRTATSLGAGVKFAVPTVADGKVFVGSSNSVSVFGLLAGTFSFSSANYSVPEKQRTCNRHREPDGRHQRRGPSLVCHGRGRNGRDRRGLHRRFRRAELDER
jgi:hypothetical protein